MATAKPKSKTPPKAKPKINYNFDSRNESAKEYNQRIGIARGESQSAIDKRNKGTEKVFKDRGLDANKKNGGQSIQAANIGTTSPVIPPKPVPTDTGDMLGMNNASVLQEGLTLDGGQFVKDPQDSEQMSAAKEYNANIGNVASSILGYIKPEANQAQNAYEDTYGITSRQAGREYRRAQQDVQQYTSQLNSITSSRDAAVLALEDTGRGQTTGFIGGEQARINREAAIQALPVQAQLAAAQGNLEIAKSHVDSLFQMKIKDIETEQAYKNTVANIWMSVATTQQSNLLNAAIADSNARAAEKTQALALANQWAQTAYDNGQSTLAAKMMKLDPTSKTFQQDLAALQGQVVKPITTTQKAPTMQNFGTADNPDWRQFNYSTESWEPVAGVGGTGEGKPNPDAMNMLQTANTLLNDPSFDRLFGIPNIKNWIPGTEVQNTKAVYNQLKGQLSLENRQKLKGSGAVSDFESKTLERAASSLDTWQSEEAARNSVYSVIGVGRNSAGLETTVKITDPSTGHSTTINASREGVNQAIADGLTVEYVQYQP